MSALSQVLLKELAPERRLVERRDPRFGEDKAIGARPMDDLGATATTCGGGSAEHIQRWRSTAWWRQGRGAQELAGR
jgi:hypothetical protein